MGQLFYRKFIDQMAREGFSEYDAAQMEGAREAHEQDRIADQNVMKAKTTAQWLKPDAQGKPTVAFETQEQMLTAINDPLYKSSPAYRDAVQDCIGRMATVTPNIEHGVGVDFSVESLAVATRKEAARDAYRKLVVQAGRDPQARMQLIELLNNPDPSVQAWISEGTDAIGNEGPGQRMMREAGSGSYGPDLGKAMAADENNGPVTEAEAGKVPA
ncbi:MAG: hypothetical protein HOP22_06050 [Nitrospiraceae bacterium]|nr:hypothetical protein [Nitrospiraceae bacterium]